MAKYKKFLGLGIAGNFALHLAQAGELEEFKDIVTEDEAAPKGIFPFYLPRPTSAKKDLNIYPLSSEYIRLPQKNVNIQAEPEVGLICTLEYTAGKISDITPTHFGAYNDCSIRIAGAEKISDKKNWGVYSKGFSNNLIEIDRFEEGGNVDNYSIASFLLRDSQLHPYGENVTLNGYSYFYKKLLDWIVYQITYQENFGPLEAIEEYVLACDNPTQLLISIGATRYTEYGEKTFLALGDEVIVVLYKHKEISYEELIQTIKSKDYTSKSMSILSQQVIE